MPWAPAWGVGQQAGPESLHVCLDVVGLEADVVQPTALFEVFDGTFAVERMHQLNPGAVDGRKAVLVLAEGNIFPAGKPRPCFAEATNGGLEVGNSDGDVVESSDRGAP